MFLVPDFVSSQSKSQEMFLRVVSEDPFLIVYYPDRYKTQRMCDEAVNGSIAALRFLSDWFVKSKMIKKFFTDIYADDNIICFNEYSGDVIFCCNEMGILRIDLNNINLDNSNYDEEEPETIIHVRLLAWHIKFEKRKVIEKIVKGKN